MKKGIHVSASALLVAMLSACGGGGGDSPTNTNTNTDSSSTGGSTQAPAAGASHTNPLQLNPAPQFSTSSRAVTYDDCFPKFDDVVVGDVLTRKVETYVPSTGNIVTGTQTSTVIAVTPETFNGLAALRVKTDSPPYIRSDNVEDYGVESTALYLDGGSATKSLVQYLNNGSGTRADIKNYSNEISVIGLMPAAQSTAALAMGASTSSSFTQTYTSPLLPDFSQQASVTEKVTFIGVEEGTEVEAGTFDYACVFRYEITDVVNGSAVTAVHDVYTHKWSTLKILSYNSVTRPLVTQVASNSAIDRRKTP